MTLKEKILHELSLTPGRTDAELKKRFGVRHQAVNQTCRQLEQQGKLKRDNTQGIIKNYLVDNLPVMQEHKNINQFSAKVTNGLHEDPIKEILNAWLKENGWDTEIAWGKKPGADIIAIKNNHKWIIEVKGCGSSNPMRVNYFLAILGEILQRMNDPSTKYSIALPNMKQYLNLWNRLPTLAKEKTQISAIFISENGDLFFKD